MLGRLQSIDEVPMEAEARGKDEILVCCDASFSKQYQIAVAGFVILENDVSVLKKEDPAPVQMRVFSERNNIAAELSGAVFSLEVLIAKHLQLEDGFVSQNRRITLITDCQTIVRLKGRREKLESSGFVAKSTGKILNNADLYERYFSLCDKVDLQVRWVRGHSQSAVTDPIEREFRRLDKTVRKKLRDVCANFPSAEAT